nr:hypothetical protein [uncultured Allomuricauda sp.]
MEFEKFDGIRQKLCSKHPKVTEGKMMSSPAIHYNNKVFAFFSRKQKMVFKLGKDFNLEGPHLNLKEFNPFKNKGPLTGWYEMGFEEQDAWEEMTEMALTLIKEKA